MIISVLSPFFKAYIPCDAASSAAYNSILDLNAFYIFIMEEFLLGSCLSKADVWLVLNLSISGLESRWEWEDPPSFNAGTSGVWKLSNLSNYGFSLLRLVSISLSLGQVFFYAKTSLLNCKLSLSKIFYSNCVVYWNVYWGTYALT